jgi:hypothetical protein
MSLEKTNIKNVLKKSKTSSDKTKADKNKRSAKKSKPLLATLKAVTDLLVIAKYNYKKDSVVFFCGDPGIKNFGYVIVKTPRFTLNVDEANNEQVLAYIMNFLADVKLTHVGFLQQTLTEVKQGNIIPHIQDFREKNSTVFNTPVDHVVMERYQARGFKGPSNEIINLNLSLTVNNFLNKQVSSARLLIPAQWKRYYNLLDKPEGKGLDILYDAWKNDKQLKRNCKLTEHQTDAFLLGIYAILDMYLKERKDLKQIRQAVVGYLLTKTPQYFRVFYNIVPHL